MFLCGGNSQKVLVKNNCCKNHAAVSKSQQLPMFNLRDV